MANEFTTLNYPLTTLNYPQGDSQNHTFYYPPSPSPPIGEGRRVLKDGEFLGYVENGVKVVYSCHITWR